MRCEQEHRGAGAVVERWRGAEWCRGAEVVQNSHRFGAEVQNC